MYKRTIQLISHSPYTVIKNVVHVTASGLYATWYFMSGLGMPSNPTQKAFKRAVTTSFGSICLGSLLVAILKTLRQIVDSARRNNNNILFCLLSCILSCLDSLLRYFSITSVFSLLFLALIFHLTRSRHVRFCSSCYLWKNILHSC